MLILSLKILLWNLGRNRGRTLIMTLTVFCSLSSYVLLGTALEEMAADVTSAMRSDWPFDVILAGRVTREQRDSVLALPGAVHTEANSVHDVFLGSSTQRILAVPDSDTALIVELAVGALPTTAEQITIPPLVADAFGLTVGDEIRLTSQRPEDAPREYEVVGILSGKSKVLQAPLLTLQGIERLLPGRGYYNQLLVQLDGKTDLADFARRVSIAVPDLDAHLQTDAYLETQQNRSMSDSLVIGLRTLILLITATSLGVLFYISQRDGAYQTGVLRALGMQRGWLLLPSGLLAATILLFSFPLTMALLPTLAAQVGLQSGPEAIIHSLYSDAGVYLTVGLLSTLAVNWQFLSQPIPQLLRDAW